jgi:O-antigen ligase
VRVMMVALLLFALPPLLFTLSRASYLALITALLSLLAISRHRVLIGAIIVALIAAVLLGLPMLPSRVQERVAGTFEQETEFHVQIGEVHFDASSSARLLSYGLAVRKWTHRPLFGYGVTGTHFIDGQYPRLLVETGVVGLAVFLFVFWRLLRLVWQAFRECTDPFLKGATMGFYCAIIAMLAHALSANSFIIVRIAEPFWMLAALVLLVPRLSKRTEDGQDDARKHDTGEHLAAGGSDMCNDE